MSEQPNLLRRRLLIGLAAASTAAADGASPALADAPPAENPELLRLAGDLGGLYREYYDAWHVVDQIVRRDPWPEPPVEIIKVVGFHGVERDVTGGARYLYRADVEERGIGTSGYFRSEAQDVREVLRKNTKSMQRAKQYGPAYWQAELQAAERALPLAEAYENACINARKTSGYEPARERLSMAVDALRDHVAAILACEERGMEGVVIKAQAIATWNRLTFRDRAFETKTFEWSGQFASSVLRIAGDVGTVV